MVKRLKLNEKTLREAEPRPGVSYQIFDTEVIGFAARVQASGARTFTIDYRRRAAAPNDHRALAGVECPGRASACRNYAAPSTRDRILWRRATNGAGHRASPT